MAQRIEIKDVTITAGTLKTAPATTGLTWREGYLSWIEIRFPPGPSGLVGIQLLHSGTRVIPKADNNFLITDNEVLRWDLEGYPYNAAWAVRGYNADVYDHTIQLRVGINEVGRQEIIATPSTLPPIPVVSSGALGEGLILPEDVAPLEVSP